MEDKCVWTTCGSISLMRNNVRETLNLAVTLGWKALGKIKSDVSQKRKKFRIPQMGLAERRVEG